jgi:hypothetical protein
VSPVRVRVPPLLFYSDLQVKYDIEEGDITMYRPH